MGKKQADNQLLLLEDVRNLGRKGDLAKAKPGFVRNFLLPQKKAVLADKRTIRLQARLQEERAKQAAKDKKESEALAQTLKGKVLLTKVKSDSSGHLYGSVSALEVVKLLSAEGLATLERKNVVLPKPIKQVGDFEINLLLPENVPASFTLKVRGDQVIEEVKPNLEIVDESEEAVEEGEAIPTPDQEQAEIRDEIEERSKD